MDAIHYMSETVKIDFSYIFWSIDLILALTDVIYLQFDDLEGIVEKNRKF